MWTVNHVPGKNLKKDPVGSLSYKDPAGSFRGRARVLFLDNLAGFPGAFF